MIQGSTHRSDLGGVAQVPRDPGAVRVDLGRAREAGAGDACAQAERRERVVDDTALRHRDADDRAVLVGRGDVSDPLDAGNDRGLEFRLRILTVGDGVEAIWKLRSPKG